MIWVAEVPQKNSSFSAVLFFSTSAPVFLFAVLQSLSFLFLCKIFWAGKRNSSSSWKSLFAVEENYLSRALTSLISLQWVMYERSFQVRDGRWWEKIQECQMLKLGMPMCTHNKYSRRLKRLILGMPLMHPLLHQQSSVCPSLHYIFITSCVMCYAWASRSLLF